ncbi:BBS1 [Symbiodinium pilosum]|uniref:BBS1 protein n=1 Tax=Symbiodinium pilosum TaxID=2952 RepID=A0A812UXV5_SYMPI|nr:BBS1 [Symbiodinium pilosum]
MQWDGPIAPFCHSHSEDSLFGSFRPPTNGHPNVQYCCGHQDIQHQGGGGAVRNHGETATRFKGRLLACAREFTRSRGFQASSDLLTRTPLASWTDPPWAACIWSKPQECDGKLEVDTASGFPQAEGRAQLSIAGGHDVQLTLRLVPPGEVHVFLDELANWQHYARHALVAASGIIAGKIASGACVSLTALPPARPQNDEGGPRVAAQLILDLGADPRALADDGLSPYTAAILKEDPCGMLSGLDSGLRLRILKGDKTAWAEVARSAQGRGPPDIAAGALSRGLAIPESMAEELLGYCFEADLPLLTLRGTRLLLDAFMDYLRASEAEEFLSDPCALPQTRGGAECPICLEPLCRSTPTAFVDAADIAVCLHLLCSSCARGYASSTNSQGEALRCPECRRHAVTMKQLPSLSEDPLHWFEFLAGASDTVSVNGKVAKSMLLRTISSMLPVEADAIEVGPEDVAL